jgi:hypothetical protein
MSSVPVDPTKFIDLYFVIKKIGWSIYEVDYADVKGSLRLLGIPTNILEIPEEMLPSGSKPPVIALNIQGIVAFTNQGNKGSSERPILPEEFDAIPKDDITSYVTPRDEPFNEFVVQRISKPALLVRTRTVLIKAEVFRNKYNPFGDPVVWVNHNTTHSLSEYKEGEMFFP